MGIFGHLCRLPVMRIDIALPESLTRIRFPKRFSIRCSGDSSSVAMDFDFDPKVFRKNLTRSKNHNRKGFGYTEETLQLMNREYTSVHHDLTLPLSHYFIYTSHNSYLIGNQLSSDCSDVPIITALKRGVRVIELDIWPNASKDNIDVLHNRRHHQDSILAYVAQITSNALALVNHFASRHPTATHTQVTSMTLAFGWKNDYHPDK